MRSFATKIEYDELIPSHRHIGSGSFASVYRANTDDRVVKVFNPQYNKPYLAFVKYIETHKSESFPRIFNTFTIVGGRFDGMKAVEMEKLKPNRRLNRKVSGMIIGAGCTAHRPSPPDLVMWKKFKGWESFKAAYAGLFESGIFDQWEFDLYPASGNIMSRSDGTAVITDPVC